MILKYSEINNIIFSIKKVKNVKINKRLLCLQVIGGLYMDKKVALITGASSGIGREFAHIHAKNGGDLIIVARRKDRLNELKQELENQYKVNVKVISKDLTLPSAAIEIYNEVKESGINVDYLINNGGFGGRGFWC